MANNLLQNNNYAVNLNEVELVESNQMPNFVLKVYNAQDKQENQILSSEARSVTVTTSSRGGKWISIIVAIILILLGIGIYYLCF